MSVLSLKNPKEFDLVNKHGTKRYGAYFIAIIAKNFTEIPKDSEEGILLGMKVSKKFSKKAVVRNKIKRRIRHLVRLLAKDPEIDTHDTALIIIPKRSSETVTFQKLSNDLKKILLTI